MLKCVSMEVGRAKVLTCAARLAKYVGSSIPRQIAPLKGFFVYQKDLQARLEALYTSWKATLQFTNEEAGSLGSPMLLHVTKDYCQAEQRVLLLGQETYGWQWDSKLQDKATHPRWTYPHPWEFHDIYSCGDFQTNVDSIEALCWAYREFKFGAHQPNLRNTPFWRAFKEVQKWPEAGVMWSNTVRMDYSPPDGKHSSLSI